MLQFSLALALLSSLAPAASAASLEAPASRTSPWKTRSSTPYPRITMVAGNMDSHNRLNYTVVGDSVNLAARLESLTRNELRHGDHRWRSRRAWLASRLKSWVVAWPIRQAMKPGKAPPHAATGPEARAERGRRSRPNGYFRQSDMGLLSISSTRPFS